MGDERKGGGAGDKGNIQAGQTPVSLVRPVSQSIRLSGLEGAHLCSQMSPGESPCVLLGELRAKQEIEPDRRLPEEPLLQKQGAANVLTKAETSGCYPHPQRTRKGRGKRRAGFHQLAPATGHHVAT